MYLGIVNRIYEHYLAINLIYKKKDILSLLLFQIENYIRYLHQNNGIKNFLFENQFLF